MADPFSRREDPEEKFREMRERMDRDFFADPQFFGRDQPFFRSRPAFEDFPSMGFPDRDVMRQPSPGPNSVQGDAIPIRVVHESFLNHCNNNANNKPKAYTSSNTTTDLPAKNQPFEDTEGSPRLARAHSEPPKSFSQRLHKAKVPLIGVPENKDLSLSASDSSVPNQNSHGQGGGGGGGDQDAVNEEPTVRHIPIFVEGRDRPVVVNNEKQQPPERPKRPSDFYPPNVEKKQPTTLKQKVDKLEPTSPLSPIPSDQPIPMGYSQPEAEPTEAKATQDPPLGPIPLPCSPDLIEKSRQVEPNDDSGKEAEVPVDDQRLKKLAEVQATVDDLAKRLEAFGGQKKDKEYAYLDEMLTRNLLILDGIETDGREDVRQQRKESIKSINRYLSILESKASNSAPKEAEKNDEILSALAQQSQEDS